MSANRWLRLAVTVAGAAAALGAAAAERTRPYVYAGSTDFAPFEYLDRDGKPAGFNIDLIRAIAAEAGVEIDVRLVATGLPLLQLESGEADLVSLARTPQREGKFGFITTTWTLRQAVIFEPTRLSVPKRIDELKSETIAVSEGTATEQMLRALDERVRPTLVLVRSQAEGVRRLLVGDVTGVAGNSATLRRELALNGNAGAPELAIGSFPYQIATRLGEEQAFAWVEAAYRSLDRAGLRNDLVEQHLLAYATPAPHMFRWFVWSGIAFAGVLALVTIWNVSLRRRVEQRTAALDRSVKGEREQASLLTSVVQGMGDGVLLMDMNGFTTLINPAAERILGVRSPREIMDKWRASVYRLDGVTPLKRGESPVERVQAGLEGDVDVVYRPPGARESKVLRFLCRAIRDEKSDISRIVAVVHDVTAAQREIEARRQAEIEAMRTSAMKSQFVANMSHEIRTPLNGVVGMVDLLMSTVLSAQQREYASLIRASADGLVAIVNDILDFSKIESGALQLESVAVDLRAVIDDVVGLLAQSAHRKGVEIAAIVHPSVPDRISGDGFRIKQVLMNLCGNAVKFTDQGSVVVDATSEQGVVRLTVRDTGRGISEEEQSRLFQAFTQADASTTRRFGGTGLGLQIARALARLMGGDVVMKSSLGLGSSFTFEAPLPALGAPASGATLRGVRALILDNDAASRRGLTLALERLGAAVETCSSADDALTRIDELFAARVKPYVFVDPSAVSAGHPLLSLNARAESRARRVFLTPRIGAEPVDLSVDQVVLAKPVRLHSLTAALTALVEEPQTVKAAAEAQFSAVALVAEDNIVNQRVAVRLLESLGYSVVVANNGIEAVDAVSRRRFDIVLMDGQMPEMDGLEATRRIRRLEPWGASVPIVALTASAMAGDRERCLEAGMDDYLAKPFTRESLAKVVSRFRPETRTGTEG